METSTAMDERRFAMEVFEHAVLMSVNGLDRDSFQRYISCLKPYYTHYSRYAVLLLDYFVLLTDLCLSFVELASHRFQTWLWDSTFCTYLLRTDSQISTAR